ncbi:MAG: CHAT domain-containing protein [Acidobacteriota bacterium]|nr:CHAT domain-containing protein [Acidobacteriota bacterium]
MVSSQTTGCLEPEVLAAYVDHGLSLAERSRVEAHLASCPHCIAMVAGVVRTVEAVSAFLPVSDVAVETPSRSDRRLVAGMLTAAAAVFVVLAAPSLVRPWLDRDTGLVSLADSVEGERSVLGRLTGGFPHAPLGVPSAGGQGGRAAEADRIVLIAGKIRESFGERETPSRLHALGVEQLLAGRYDDAAASLLAAAREQPNNARYVSDVATVQLERARRGLRPDDLPRALASADRARRLDPTLREAWFNRALAATALSLNDLAKQAWTEYLARDSASPWATEARTRLEQLSKPSAAAVWASVEQRLHGNITSVVADEAVRTQMTEARKFVETDLLPKWAAAVDAGRDASRELENVRNMADAFARVAGDNLYRDAVAAIDRSGTGDKLHALARAHSVYATAASLFAADRFAEAGPGMAAARAQLKAAGSAFAIRPTLDLGAIAYVQSNYVNAIIGLEEVHSAATANGYAYVGGRAKWFLGLVAFAQGRLADAQANYEDALATFERMGDAEQVAAAHPLLASLYFYLGDSAAEWRHRTASLQGLSISRSARFKFGLLATAAFSVRAESPETALSIYELAVANARESGRDAAVVEALAQRSVPLLALGRASEAERDLEEARRHLRNLPDESHRRLLELPVLAAESDLARSRNPAAAAAAATRAIETSDQRGDRTRLPQLYLRLAKANIVWGNHSDAEAALNKGIEAFDTQRASLVDEGRIAATDESWQLFETSVQLSIRKGDYPRAFAMAERARARTLAEARRMPERSLGDVQRALAPEQAVVALSQFDDELAVWVIRHDKTDVLMRPISRLDAQKLVARQQAEIWHGSETPVAGRDLYNEILRPIGIRLRGASRLVIVPDATYEDAAFAALWDGSRQRFLVEDVTLSLAPSVGALVTALQATPAIARAGRPMIMGGPDRTADADAIAALYPEPTLVTGSSATRTRLFSEAPGHSVVHLSVATARNASYPLLSRVRLVDERGRRHSGDVLGHEIAARSMPDTNLVVIDEVEVTSANRGEGTLNLARAFMAAGVPAVVGTLPGADETATRDLMVGFHRRLASGMSAAEALTDLQRNVLQSNGRRLGAWSALVLYGSDR